jgi:hypothetical protein
VGAACILRQPDAQWEYWKFELAGSVVKTGVLQDTGRGKIPLDCKNEVD